MCVHEAADIDKELIIEVPIRIIHALPLVSGSVSAATDIFNVVLARRRGVEDPLIIYHRGN
jgi:hypothetical protein